MGWAPKIEGRHSLSLVLLAFLGMMSFIAIAAAQSRSAVSLASADGAGRRVALVIGNAAYEQAAPLNNPRFDAELMTATLEDAGFAVTEIVDATQSEMKRALLEFGRALRQEGVEAGLFYYAGHGVQVRGENYLIPVNAVINDEDEVDIEGVNVNSFLQAMNSSKTKINIVILDACRNNPFARSFRSMSRGLAPVDAPKGTYIAYSTSPGSVALDGAKEGNSPYTAALAAAIADAGAPIESVFKAARRSVLEATGSSQVPWDTSSIVGDFYFHPEDDDPAAAANEEEPASASPGGGMDVAAWRAIQGSRDVGDFESFVEAFGEKNEFLRSLAEKRIRQLREDDEEAVPAAEEEQPEQAQELAALPAQPGGGVAAPATRELLVGLGGPITGPNAVFGEQMRRGAEMAASDLNASGGVNGQQLVLRFGDDVSDPKQGIATANKFVADGVRFVIGHFNSGVSIPASEVYAENDVLIISPASTNPVFTERGLWNTFRTTGRDDQQGIFAGRYIAGNFAGKRVAIVHDGSTYGEGLAEQVRQSLNAAGVQETLFEAIEWGKKDYAPLVKKLKAARIQVVYYGGLHTEAGLIIRQAAKSGLKLQFMGGDGLVSSELASIAGPAIDGMLMTFSPDPRNNPRAKRVVQALRASGYEPEGYAIYAYAAVEVLAAAAALAGTNEPQQVAAMLRSGRTFSTALGDLAFDAKGDRKDIDFTMYVWKKAADGQFTYVQQ